MRGTTDRPTRNSTWMGGNVFNIEKLKQQREKGYEKLNERFGSREPDMATTCSRCHQRYGVHYGTVAFLYCPDEWVADGHSLWP